MGDPYRTHAPEVAAPRASVLAEVTITFCGSVLRVEHLRPTPRPRIYRLGDGPGVHFSVPDAALPAPGGTPLLHADPGGLGVVLTRGLRGVFWNDQRRRPLAEEVGAQPWVTRRLDPHTGCRIDLGPVQVWVRGVPDDAVAPRRNPIERPPIVASLLVALVTLAAITLALHLPELPFGSRPYPYGELRFATICRFGDPAPVPIPTHVLGRHPDPGAEPLASARPATTPWPGTGDGLRAERVDRLALPDPRATPRTAAGAPDPSLPIGRQGAAPATDGFPGVRSRAPWIATRAHAAVGFRPGAPAPDPASLLAAVRRGARPSLEPLTDPAALLRLVAPERPRVHGSPLGLATQSAMDSSGHQIVRVVVQARTLEHRRLGDPLVPIAHDVEIVARFVPEHVTAFRPIGHRQRIVGNGPRLASDEPPAVTAGRVIVALYELELADDAPDGAELAQLEVHYRLTPDGPRLVQRQAIHRSSTPLPDASEALRLATVAARAAEILADGPTAAGYDLSPALAQATAIAESGSDRAAELAALLRYALSQPGG